METKVAVLSVIVENSDSVEALNCILHTYGDYIIGRMGLPYRPKHINLISLAVDAQEEIINKLAENSEGLAGVSVKVVTSNI